MTIAALIKNIILRKKRFLQERSKNQVNKDVYTDPFAKKSFEHLKDEFLNSLTIKRILELKIRVFMLHNLQHFKIKANFFINKFHFITKNGYSILININHTKEIIT